MKIIICRNKLPDRKLGWTCSLSRLNEWTTSWPEEMAWEFLEFEKKTKTDSWSTTVKGAVFRIGSDPLGSRPAKVSWDLRHCKIRRLWWGESAKNGLHRPLLFVCLASCRQDLEAKRNKSVRIRNDRVRLYYYYYRYHHGYTTQSLNSDCRTTYTVQTYLLFILPQTWTNFNRNDSRFGFFI